MLSWFKRFRIEVLRKEKNHSNSSLTISLRYRISSDEKKQIRNRGHVASRHVARPLCGQEEGGSALDLAAVRQAHAAVSTSRFGAQSLPPAVLKAQHARYNTQANCILRQTPNNISDNGTSSCGRPCKYRMVSVILLTVFCGSGTGSKTSTCLALLATGAYKNDTDQQIADQIHS